ncbi:MAG: sigma-54-dependent Fis family transcriptional regulator [Polyangiaceae bacterium]|nr:sigma-54-dependent Fis family transcriptional regulator [Polyangiaceae bacterium]
MRDLDYRKFDILVVDDEEDNLDAFRFSFRRSFTLHYALGAHAALEKIQTHDFAVIVSDQRMPQMSGIELLERAKQVRPDAVGILLTAYADLDVLIHAVNSGAVERYIQKPWDSKELSVILRQAISSFATVRENRRLREQLSLYTGYLEREQRDPIDFGEITGKSALIKEVAARIDEVSRTTSPVLIEGETGSEKEVVARAVHVGSPREEMPFVKVTCAAFRGEALERELFGYMRGSFEGAFNDRAGRFELAHRGTIFLDEPTNLPPSAQARLLRVLTDGEVERVGGTEPIAVDVRVVIALTPSLAETWGAEGVLPELVSKVSVFPIHIAPLRDRKDDIVPLAEHFLRKYARRNPRAATKLSADALTKLVGYDFPGNVRELENVVERAAILSRSDTISAEHLAFATPKPPVRTKPLAPAAESVVIDAVAGPRDLDERLEDMERTELMLALARAGGNKAEMARQLGIQRTTLYYRLKKLGIET